METGCLGILVRGVFLDYSALGSVLGLPINGNSRLEIRKSKGQAPSFLPLSIFFSQYYGLGSSD